MKTSFTLLLCLISLITFSQTSSSWSIGKNVDYEIVHDVIDKPFAIANLDVVQLDMNTGNMGGSGFNLALRGFVDPIEMGGLDFTFRRSLLTALFRGFNTDIELGGHYYLIKSEKKKNTKVILRQSWDNDYSGARALTVTNTKSIQIPANRLIYRGVRAGLISKKGPYEVESMEGLVDADVTLTSTGIYVGVLQKALQNIFVNTKQYGEAYASVGRDLAIDMLFYPSHGFDITNIEGTASSDQIENNAEGGNIGVRAVYNIYQIEKKEYTGKMFGATKRFEVGYKPYQGMYFAVGYGFTILKSKFSPF